LGCGNGSLCKKITWKYKHFVGVDFAPGMLELHPKSKKIECVYGDFNDKELFENLLTYRFDYIISSSALQWANDLDFVLKSIKNIAPTFALSIFTSNTFKELHNQLCINSPIPSKKEILKAIQNNLENAKILEKKYTLNFDFTKDLLSYIKKSGVSSGAKLSSLASLRDIIKKNSIKQISAEVIFVYG
jgi:malonyl-CoA O-methyltransferase